MITVNSQLKNDVSVITLMNTRSIFYHREKEFNKRSCPSLAQKDESRHHLDNHQTPTFQQPFDRRRVRRTDVHHRLVFHLGIVGGDRILLRCDATNWDSIWHLSQRLDTKGSQKKKSHTTSIVCVETEHFCNEHIIKETHV